MSRKGSLPSTSSSLVTDGSQASSELKMSSLWNGNLTSSMNYHVMRATLHILAKLSIPCVRGSFLGLMHILNSTRSLSPRSKFKLHLRDNPTHSFDRDKIEVLDSSPYNVDLETKESLYISYLKPSLNTDTKSRPLLLF